MKRHWSRIFAYMLGIPLLLALLAACGAGTETAGPASGGATTIKIGTDFPVSGKDTAGGKPTENGAHYAVDEANTQNFIPGYKFVFVPKDDVGASGSHEGTVGQKNANDLIGDALVAGIVGPLNSSVAVAMLPVTNQAPIALISPANTNNCLTQTMPEEECGGAKNKISTYRPTGKVTYFRIATLDMHQGAALANFAYNDKVYKTVYVVDDQETYGVGIATNFINQWKKNGGTVIARKSVKSTTSYENLLTEIASTEPDVIFFGGNDSTGGTALRQQMPRIPGLEETALIVGDGTKTSAFASAVVPTGGGPVYSSVAGQDAAGVPAAKKFIEGYNKAYGQANLGSYTPAAYDSTWILMTAIKKVIQDRKVITPKDSNDAAQAKIFRQAVIDTMQGIKYDGVTGSHSFDQNGDTKNKAISIYTLGDDPKVGDGWKYTTSVKPDA